MLTSISPSPPAGMSFLDRRTGVQPHPEPTRSMMSVAEPALWKLKRHDCSLFSGTSPKSCSSRSNWIEGFPKKKAVDNNAPARTTADRFIALPLYFGCIGEHTRMLASRNLIEHRTRMQVVEALGERGCVSAKRRGSQDRSGTPRQRG